MVYDEEAVRRLYLDNKWYEYLKEIDRLFEGIKRSTDCIGAYDEETLVGLIRTVSDQQTICYIQDILILDDYKRQGIGTKLMSIILDKYSDVRQINLMTGMKEYQKAFYERLGFKLFEKDRTIGYTYQQGIPEKGD